jgi:hypothetical protein
MNKVCLPAERLVEMAEQENTHAQCKAGRAFEDMECAEVAFRLKFLLSAQRQKT